MILIKNFAKIINKSVFTKMRIEGLSFYGYERDKAKVCCNKIKIPFCRYVLVFGKRGLYILYQSIIS